MTQLLPTWLVRRIRLQKLWLVLLLLCFFVQLFNLVDWLRFDRGLIEQQQYWRLLTGHISHLNWSHLGLNMAGLLMVAFFFATYRTQKYWLGALLVIALLCSGGLMLDQQLNRYVGLSAILHGLFVIGGRWELKRFPLSGAVLLVLVLAKLLWEQLYGALPGSESMAGGRIAVNSHLYGALAGVFYLLLTEKTRWR